MNTEILNPSPASEDTGGTVKPPVPIPARVSLNSLHELSMVELHRLGREMDLRVAGSRSKFQLIFEIASYYEHHGSQMEAEGVLEINMEGFGFIRWPRYSFVASPDSVYLAPPSIRRYNLRPGNLLRGTVRSPKHKEKYFAMDEIIQIEGQNADCWEAPTPFDRLTALFPSERIILENKVANSVSARVVDLVAPLGKGQRGLIVASPRSGKTILLKEIAKAISLNYPDLALMVVLVDERPEEVTDFRETVNTSVYSSTFDETPTRHIQVAELVLERAKRLVELRKDVVILLDSITRLSRGYNNLMGSKGGVTQGGLNPKALQRSRKFFSAARKVEEGGSLTILGTALVETENRMDDIIFQEFKGTGNLEVFLDRDLSEKRIYPAINILDSGTRKADLLYHPDEYMRINLLRKQLAQVPAVEAMEKLVRNVKRTSSNIELLLSGLK